MPSVSLFFALNLQQMFSQRRDSKKDGTPTTDFAFLRKLRHARGDTPGFWIIPRTPPARNKFPTARSRLRGKKKRGVSRIRRFRTGETW